MRTHGTLIKWNTERGFGFVALPQSHEEVFVHISAFPRDGVSPRIGETISFEVRSGPDGRKRAEAVMRAGARAPAQRPRRHVSAARRSSPSRAMLAILVVAVLGFAAYRTYPLRHTTGSEPQFALPQASPSAAARFTCDGRTYCSQMTSCAEAEYFLQHCPGTKMDGNHDGEPCEQQWCN